MIDEYKDYLKRNKEDIFSCATAGIGMVLFLFIFFGSITTLSTITRFVGNSTKLNVYRVNLATFQKCAEKVTDVSLIESYCGETPSEPVVVW